MAYMAASSEHINLEWSSQDVGVVNYSGCG